MCRSQMEIKNVINGLFTPCFKWADGKLYNLTEKKIIQTVETNKQTNKKGATQ